MRDARNADFRLAGSSALLRAVCGFESATLKVAALIPALSVLPSVHAGEALHTNVASLRLLTRLQANRGAAFQLQGAVTLIDPERKLFVLQDDTGAIAIHPDTLPAIHSGD